MASPTGSFELAVSLGEDSFSASGRHDLVVKAFEDFKALAGRSPGSDRAAPERSKSSPIPARASAARSAHQSEGMSLPAFLASLKGMKGNAQIAAAIITWSTQHDGKAKLTASEIRALWEGTKYRVPSPANVIRDLNNAVKQGLIRKEGKGQGQVFYANTYEQEQVAKWTTIEA